MTTHELKTWPEAFAAVLDGTKTHDIRKADRPFAVGDVLRLMEWAPRTGGRGAPQTVGMDGSPQYTGRTIDVEVTYVSRGGTWGLPSDLCVMSIRVLPDPAEGATR